jgi:hypothetical protein
MHVVVNQLHFRDPVTEATVEATREALQLVIDAGGIAARVVKVDDRHLILLSTSRQPRTPIVPHARLAAHGCVSTSPRFSPAAPSAASAR